MKFILAALSIAIPYLAFAQTRSAPPPPSSPPMPRARAPVSRPQFSGRPGASSFGAGVPLMRSVFVPNIGFEMNFHSKPEVDCPTYFTALDEAALENSTHESRYYGEAPMRWFSSSISLVSQSNRLAVWRGRMSPEFIYCHATATMTTWGGRPLRSKQGHLSLVIKNGTVTLTADLSRFKNAALNHAGLSEGGRPVWSWSLRKL